MQNIYYSIAMLLLTCIKKLIIFKNIKIIIINMYTEIFNFIKKVTIFYSIICRNTKPQYYCCSL